MSGNNSLDKLQNLAVLPPPPATWYNGYDMPTIHTLC